MVLETAYRGLGFSRVVLFVREPKRGCMAARFGLGPEVDQLLPRLRFCPGGAEDPFAVAVREQRDLVHEVGGKAALEALPEWYRGISPAATFALLPLVVNRVCLGLVYADRATPGRTITPTEMGYLHTLRNQAVLAIKQRG
jgi:GAF domain-containing protein